MIKIKLYVILLITKGSGFMNKVFKVVSSNNYVFSNLLLNVIDHNMSLNDFLLLVYLINDHSHVFDAEAISTTLNISMEDVMNSFNNLIAKNLIDLSSGKDVDGRITDLISLDKLYELIDNQLNDEAKENNKANIFELVEKEFGRSLSPIECEIINGWLDTGNTEELILGALKEATYNGVKNLRYIDKILYEWGKKGFKTMDDVNAHIKNNKDEKETKELFEYNWIDDDE